MRALSLGRLEGDADAVTGVEVDSRRIRPGDLFVAVSGGEAYLADARARGAAAIGRAIELARPGDVVLIAGKGAEQGQEFADRTVPFDDREAAKDALRGAAA